MAQSTIASAVTVPEPIPDQQPRTNGLKRRQSEMEEQDGQESKRQRISPGKNSPIASREEADDKQQFAEDEKTQAQTTDPREVRRKSTITDEKDRSKRLFGALLGNLNQPGDRTSKRRQEIESRRKAELQRQDDERLEVKQRRQEKLTEQKKKMQIDLEEENIRMRHRNLLDSANFLQTATEPKIFYRPWELRPDEEDRIDEQIKGAQAHIDRELNKSEEQDRRLSKLDEPNTAGDRSPLLQSAHHEALEAGSAMDVDAVQNPEVEEEQAPAKSANEDAKPAEVPDSDETNHDTNNDEPPPVVQGEDHKDLVNEDVVEEGDHVVEGDEDTVIY